MPKASTMARKAPRRPSSPGERLLAAFAGMGEDPQAHEDFCLLADSLISQGRRGVLDIAMRRLAVSDGEEAANDLAQALADEAGACMMFRAGGEECDEEDDGTFAQLVALPAVLVSGVLPDPEEAAATLPSSGYCPAASIRYVPSWLPMEAVLSMHPCDLRALLSSLAAGEDVSLTLPGIHEVGEGVHVMLGVELGADPGCTDEQAGAEVEAFSRWTESRAGEGVALLMPRPVSEVAAQLRAGDLEEEAEDEFQAVASLGQAGFRVPSAEDVAPGRTLH